MITIINDISSINFNYGQIGYNLQKKDMDISRNDNYVNVKDTVYNLSINYYDVISPNFASAAALEAQLLIWINQNINTGGLSEIWTATAGQTTFTPIVQPRAYPFTIAEVDNQDMAGQWYLLGTDVIFNIGLLLGQKVVITTY